MAEMTTYYERNKQRILERNKLRYKADPEYRKTVLERTTKYLKRKSIEKKDLKKCYKNESRIWRKFKVNGVIGEYGTITYLAFLLDRTTRVIKLWEQKGDFPKTFKHKGIRYYSKQQIKMIVRLFNKHGRTQKNKDAFLKEVQLEWLKLLKKDISNNGEKKS